MRRGPSSGPERPTPSSSRAAARSSARRRSRCAGCNPVHGSDRQSDRKPRARTRSASKTMATTATHPSARSISMRTRSAARRSLQASASSSRSSGEDSSRCRQICTGRLGTENCGGLERRRIDHLPHGVLATRSVQSPLPRGPSRRQGAGCSRAPWRAPLTRSRVRAAHRALSALVDARGAPECCVAPRRTQGRAARSIGGDFEGAGLAATHRPSRRRQRRRTHALKAQAQRARAKVGL